MARPARARTRKRPMNRVDGLRTLDRATNPGGALARPGAPRPSTPFPAPGRGAPPAGGGFQMRKGAPGAPQPSQPFPTPGGGMIPHPFLPGAGLGSVVPASAAEPGSAPGTPNLANMVMQSFRPMNLMQTPLVSSGSGGVPRPNPSYGFGGGQLPAGVRSMDPQQQAF
jgi:translation initiation factor IF-2